MLKGFKEFVTRGNVVDLAVGIVIGVAFAAMVTQLTKSFLEPLIKLVTGGAKAGGKFTVNGVEFDYGAFLNSVVAFLLTAAAVYFLVVVPLNRFFRRKETQPEGPSEEVRLLTEIRDRLAEK